MGRVATVGLSPAGSIHPVAELYEAADGQLVDTYDHPGYGIATIGAFDQLGSLVMGGRTSPAPNTSFVGWFLAKFDDDGSVYALIWAPATLKVAKYAP